MIIGDPSVLAIESRATKAYERISYRALGFFVIYVGGRRYGVYKPDATMLACSFDEVGRRIDDRGGHTVPFAVESDPGKVADAYRSAVYADVQDARYFDIPSREFREMIHSKHIVWAPDGDAAFDDGSFVLQFDVHDRVRLIAFRHDLERGYDPATLSDVWLAAETFYLTLQRWHAAFELEWTSMSKEITGEGTK